MELYNPLDSKNKITTSQARVATGLRRPEKPGPARAGPGLGQAGPRFFGPGSGRALTFGPGPGRPGTARAKI